MLQPAATRIRRVEHGDTGWMRNARPHQGLSRLAEAQDEGRGEHAHGPAEEQQARKERGEDTPMAKRLNE